MNDGDIKGVILHNLLKNESYSRKVVPFIKVEYFKDRRERILFESIQEFILKYNNLPTKEVLHIVLEKKETINESEHQLILDLLEELYKHQETVDSEWLLDVLLLLSRQTFIMQSWNPSILLTEVVK